MHTTNPDRPTTPAEPLGVTLAREALEAAQRELHAQIAAGLPDAVVDATRYRVLRCHDLLEQRWHDAALTACR